MSFRHGEDRLRSIPGVKSASFSYSDLKQTLSSRTILRVKVTADPTNVDSADFAGKVVRVAWAVGSKRPEGGVSITIETSPQVNYGLALEQRGWDAVTVGKPDPALFVIGFRGGTRILGDWPGELPST